MIMREYDYYTLQGPNAYGQETITDTPVGKIKMAVYIASQGIQDSILYEGAQYMGLTYNAEVRDTYVIDYEGEKMKVLYITPQTARNAPNIVYMARMG